MVDMLRDAGRRFSVPTILAVALALRLAAIPIAGDHTLAYEWGPLARNIVSGNGYAFYSALPNGAVSTNPLTPGSVPLPSLYMPPLYAFLLAGLLKILGTELAAATAVTVIQAILGSLTAWLVYRTARILAGARVAVGAAATYAIFPLAIYASAQVSAVVLYVFLAQAAIWLLLEWKYGSWHRTSVLMWAGVSAGLLLLARGEAVLTVAVMLGWILVSRGAHRGPRLGARFSAAAWFSVPALLVSLPWEVRNFLTFGRLTSLTGSAGYNLWQGQNAGATGIHGGSVSPPVTESEHLRQLLASVPTNHLYELHRDDLYMKDALQAMSSDPMRCLSLAAKKFFMYWTNLYPGIPMDYPGAQSPLVILPWMAVLVLAAIGVLFQRRVPGVLLIHVYIVANAAIVMVFFVMPRYNLTILPCLAVLAGLGIDAVLRRFEGDLRLGEEVPWRGGGGQ